MQADINFFAVIIGAVVNMIVGFVWYSPQAFGRQWMKAIGKTQKDFENMKGGANKAYALSFAGALVMSFVLAHVVYYSGSTNMVEGFIIGFLVWLGFVAPISFNSCLFEKKPLELVLINAGYYLAALIMMSIIISVMT